jgi:hypothetical protein
MAYPSRITSITYDIPMTQAGSLFLTSFWWAGFADTFDLISGYKNAKQQE